MSLLEVLKEIVRRCAGGADPATGICMSLEGLKEAFLDGYNVRFHSLKNRYPTDKFHAGWRGEFFCEPDDVILVSEVGPEGCSAAAPIFCRNSKWDKDFCRKLAPGSAEGHRHPEVTPLSPSSHSTPPPG